MATKEARAVAAGVAAVNRPQTETDIRHELEKPKNLEDPNVQAEMDDIKGKEQVVKVGGKETKLYPMAFRYAKRFAGLVNELLQASVFDPVAAGMNQMTTETGKRITAHSRLGALLERPEFHDRFLHCVAMATAPPGEMSDAEAAVKAISFDEEGGLSYIETPLVYYTLIGQNDIFKGHLGIDVNAIRDPKKPKPPEARPS